jgi:DNA-binding NtrC family response regulator
MEEPWDGAPESRTSGLHLLVMSPDMFVTHALPVSGSLTIGRSTAADVRICDPRASRRHAVLHLAETLTIEDLRSANGTRVRDMPLEAGVPVAVAPGDAVVVGDTWLMLQRGPAPAGPRRLWSHSYFENRLQEACARAARAKTSFGIGRIRVDQKAAWGRVVAVLARELGPPHLLATYGPNEYEVLFQGVEPGEATELLQAAESGIRRIGTVVRRGLAWFPRDGRSAHALIEHASVPVRAPARPEGCTEPVAPLVPAMQQLYEIAARAAAGTINVLILGETGVGKEVLAQRVHRLSSRSDKPILCLNCAGLTESLLESELFGYEKGAFTGATQPKPGLLETAQGGTVFLDEVGELPSVIQAKLLRVLETREVMRLGGLKARPIQVRFISATNRDLEAEVARENFRADLYFRLNGITLVVPPLRERVAEIPALCQRFLGEACRDFALSDTPVISSRAMAWLAGYPWPGNIRELRNVIERAVVLCTGSEIGPEHLPCEKVPSLSSSSGIRRLNEPGEFGEGRTVPPPPSKPRSRRALERQRIVEALDACAGNQSRAARLLGMPRRTLVAKLAAYGIPRPQKPALRGPASSRRGPVSRS